MWGKDGSGARHIVHSRISRLRAMLTEAWTAATANDGDEDRAVRCGTAVGVGGLREVLWGGGEVEGDKVHESVGWRLHCTV